jgi:REP element-mobilizing transposase RayT
MRELPVRKKIRLEGYDYSQAGCYFVTICTQNRNNIFGDVVAGVMQLSECGKITEAELINIPSHYENVQIGKYVVMPNHIHVIVAVSPAAQINPRSPKSDLSNVIGKYKAGVTRLVGNAFMRSVVWQKRFHDEVIRSEAEYRVIWRYIDENPSKWQDDDYF